MKERTYIVTEEFLVRYQNASLNNSRSLLEEATLLFEHRHNARAYFLACAAIEETGKAFQAFLARGRNLNNPAVQTKVKQSFEDHKSKIIMGISSLARGVVLDADKVKYLIDLSIHLSNGREKSMYVDAGEGNTITIPNELVKKEVALDALRLASDCLKAAAQYVKSSQPGKFQAHHDKGFVLSGEKFQKIMSSKDFWAYFIHLIRSDKTTDIEYAVVKYHDEYYSKRKKFSKGD